MKSYPSTLNFFLVGDKNVPDILVGRFEKTIFICARYRKFRLIKTMLQEFTCLILG